jgi:hypothetical protein
MVLFEFPVTAFLDVSAAYVSKVLFNSAPWMVHFIPRCSKKSNNVTQSLDPNSLTCSTVHEDQHNPTSNPGLLLHPRCILSCSWHEKTVIPEYNAVQSSLTSRYLGLVLVKFLVAGLGEGGRGQGDPLFPLHFPLE